MKFTTNKQLEIVTGKIFRKLILGWEGKRQKFIDALQKKHLPKVKAAQDKLEKVIKYNEELRALTCINLLGYHSYDAVEVTSLKIYMKEIDEWKYNNPAPTTKTIQEELLFSQEETLDSVVKNVINKLKQDDN